VTPTERRLRCWQNGGAVFLKVVLWLILAGVAYLVGGPWGIVAVLVMTILWVVVDATFFAAKRVVAGYQEGAELMRAAEDGDRKRAEVPTRAAAFPTASTIEQWTHRKDSPDGDSYSRMALHFPTMTLLNEAFWGVGIQPSRGEFLARRSSGGTWEIKATAATFREMVEQEDDPAERAQMQKAGRVWRPLIPEEIIGAVETAYQRYIHSGA
jgi:hypothetical protein